MKIKKHFCLCCGYNTLTKKPPQSEEICEICGWEDCVIQYLNPKSLSGLNPVSLEEAQQNFQDFGACCREMLREVRSVTSTDSKDKNYGL